jgi:hypothetical protein
MGAENMKMKALSIQQPWAWLIANGHKDIENRTWSTRFCGPVLIHTGKNSDSLSDYEIQAIAGKTEVPFPPENLKQGGIIGIVDIVDCVRFSSSFWFCGPYGFVLRNAHPLPFLSYRGQLGFFDVEVPEGYAGA